MITDQLQILPIQELSKHAKNDLLSKTLVNFPNVQYSFFGHKS